jgi:hypothetical protein
MATATAPDVELDEDMIDEAEEGATERTPRVTRPKSEVLAESVAAISGQYDEFVQALEGTDTEAQVEAAAALAASAGRIRRILRLAQKAAKVEGADAAEAYSGLLPQ